MFRTGNPALREDVYRTAGWVRTRDAMTLDGTINKTGLALMALLVSGALAWNFPPRTLPLVSLVGIVVGAFLALATILKPEWARVTTLPYAIFEGLLLGSLSRVFEVAYPGIAANAAFLTVGILMAMLLLYRLPAVRESEGLVRGVTVATMGIALVYVFSMGLRLLGGSVPFIHGSGPAGMGFSLLVVGLAALNLVVDFRFVEQGVRSGAPRHLEWYGAFSLLVTLVWLYVELLRLLSKLQDRRR